MLTVWMVGAVDATGEDWLSMKACFEGTDAARSFELLVSGSGRRHGACQFPCGTPAAIAVATKAVCKKLVCESSIEAGAGLHEEAGVLIHNRASIHVGEIPLPGVGYVCLGHCQNDEV
jgi:hypothetical protein